MRPVALLLALLALPAMAQVPDGDAHWMRRAEGARGAVAAAGEIDAAIAAYRTALATNRWDLEARWKLLRALRFKGVYVAQTAKAKKAIFEDAKRIGSVGVEQLDRHLASHRAGTIAAGPMAGVISALRPIPNAGELLFWDAVSWGEWALVFGKVAAVRGGAAARIRREATIVLNLDPHIEQGGGARILGRLHSQTPRIPLLTGWVSNAEAVKFLEQSAALDRHNKLTQIFLAEALADRKQRARAIEIARTIVSARPDPRFLVEDAAVQNDARSLLASLERR